jgi:hypothetical protein
MNGDSKMSRTLYYSASGGQLPRLTGLTFDRIIVDEMATIDKKIKWVSAEGRLRLAARAQIQPRGWEVGLTEAEMDAVHQWCQTNNCGKRTSFDTFQFKNRKEMTMFLLRWGS